MPVNIARLRKWLAGAAIVLVAVVAVTYFYGRWRVYRTVHELPSKLGVDIKQSTEGFELSKSEGGRTIFVVRASKAVQYQAGGHAELHNVLILVYGRQADRFDQIYGERFQYDPNSGDVSALGEVHIDLEGNAEGPIRPDQTQPVELKNPIHLQTSGLVFNQHTGMARTDQRIEFRTRQVSGSAQGAVYNSSQASLTLESNVEFNDAGPSPANIKARHAMITRTPYQAVLESVQIDRPTGHLRSDRLTVLFRENNTVERAVAMGDVQASGTGGSNVSDRASRAVSARAPRADASISEGGKLQSAILSGGVSFSLPGASNSDGSAGRVALNFRDGKIETMVASDGVRLTEVRLNETPTSPSPGRSRRAELSAPEVTFQFHGRKLGQATTSGTSELVFTEPGATENGRTTATAGRIVADFDEGRIRHVTAADHTRIAASRPGQPDRVTTSDNARVDLSPAGGISTLVQSGHFEYREGRGLAQASDLKSAPVEREAFAEQARFVAAEDRLTLTGSPRLEQGGVSTTADRILLARRSGEAVAEGDVKTTYSQLKQQPGGALLAASDPVHVAAASMTATQAGGVAVYRGAAQSGSQSGSAQGLARLWQGANAIQAPVIEFRSEQRTVLAKSGEPSPGMGEPGVSTVLVQQDRTGRVTPVRISARSLSYVDSERRIRFEGNVEVRGAETLVTAKQVDAFLQATGQKAVPGPAAPGTPSQIDRVVASGGVTVRQGERRAEGETLVYNADNQRFVMKGRPASIFDAERGQITGDSLTFYSRNDTVQVEGGSSPSITQTRVAK
jgi:lipopolysaccharide export system protein LptA